MKEVFPLFVGLLPALQNLKSLDLRNTRVITLGNGNLQKIKTLTTLNVAKTHVDEGALTSLRQKLPDCEVTT